MIRVLVVDDNEIFRQTVCDMLDDGDFKTLSVGSGAQSFAVLRNQSVDIVLTDIVMPDEDGLEIVRKIRKMNPAPKIVAMSGGGRIAATDYLNMARVMGVSATSRPRSKNPLSSRSSSTSYSGCSCRHPGDWRYLDKKPQLECKLPPLSRKDAKGKHWPESKSMRSTSSPNEFILFCWLCGVPCGSLLSSRGSSKREENRTGGAEWRGGERRKRISLSDKHLPLL
jgi:CheY-like chemotaxis protein